MLGTSYGQESIFPMYVLQRVCKIPRVCGDIDSDKLVCNHQLLEIQKQLQKFMNFWPGTVIWLQN